LIGNAIKFTKKGEVKVSVTEANNPEKDLPKDTCELVFKVSDSGYGIKEADLGKLFKIFGKLKQEQGVNTGGIGLGLTICKELTLKLGGNIGV
jgi:signal transduction histidine kinase